MQLLAPDLLEQARGLSPGLCALGVGVGFFLWLTGWSGHRFWVVLAATVMAGVFGLWSPPAGRVPPLVMGLLLGVTAGVLALALVRLVAFAAGGFAAYLAVHSLAPAGWDEPLVCFLAGGLVGLLLFRLWIMVLTSFCGTMLMGYSGLCWLDGLGKVNAVVLTTKREMLLNWGCGALTVLGLVVQFLLERRRAHKERLREQRTRILDEEELERLYRSRRRWGWGRRKPYRRAS